MRRGLKNNKYLFYLFLLFSLITSGRASPLYAQSNGTISLEFIYKAPILRPYYSQSGQEYTEVIIPDLPCYGPVGEPVLPVKGLRVPLPFNAHFNKIEIYAKEVAIEGEHMVRPGQPPSPYSSSEIPEEVEPSSIYDKQGYLFEKIYSSVHVGKVRGISILSFCLHPVNYQFRFTSHRNTPDSFVHGLF